MASPGCDSPVTPRLLFPLLSRSRDAPTRKVDRPSIRLNSRSRHLPDLPGAQHAGTRSSRSIIIRNSSRVTMIRLVDWKYSGQLKYKYGFCDFDIELRGGEPGVGNLIPAQSGTLSCTLSGVWNMTSRRSQSSSKAKRDRLKGPRSTNKHRGPARATCHSFRAWLQAPPNVQNVGASDHSTLCCCLTLALTSSTCSSEKQPGYCAPVGVHTGATSPFPTPGNSLPDQSTDGTGC